MAALVPAITILSLMTAAAPVEPGPIDLDAARECFARAKRLSDADGGAMWGRPLYGPVLFVDRATRTAVGNEPARGLTPQGDGVFVGRVPAEIPIANTSTEWAGVRWAMMIWPEPSAPGYGGALMMHECFHRIMPEIGLPLSVPDNHHLDTPGGRTWLRLEWRALAEALEEEDPISSAALEDALVFRAYRRALFKEAAREERELEMNEGLAEYTGLRLGVEDADETRRRAIQALRAYDGPGPLVRRFAYASGPPYGLLLDRARPQWRSTVSRSTDLGRTLQRAARIRLPSRRDLEGEALKRSGLYDYESLEKEERLREAQRQVRLDECRARYIEGPRLMIELDGETRFSFSPYDVQALDGVGTVYGTMHLNGPFGVLDAEGGALMVQEGTGRRGVVVPAPVDPDARPVHGDGWTLELEARWVLVPGDRAGDYFLRRR